MDEASQCDPALACVALMRAKRAVVVGDPQQLRHVCFLSHAREQAAFTQYELPAGLQDRFRYRRSLFDIAADAVDQHNLFFLSEHFRSHPQIIGFSNRHFYDRRTAADDQSTGTRSRHRHPSPTHCRSTR